MSAPRTITIVTVDHGPVELVEPDWCIGHHWQRDPYRDDLTHNSVRVKAGATTETHGWLPMLEARVSWAPFKELVPVISLIVDVEHDFAAEDGRAVAEGLRLAASRIEAVAAEAIRLREGLA